MEPNFPDEYGGPLLKQVFCEIVEYDREAQTYSVNLDKLEQRHLSRLLSWPAALFFRIAVNANIDEAQYLHERLRSGFAKHVLIMDLLRDPEIFTTHHKILYYTSFFLGSSLFLPANSNHHLVADVSCCIILLNLAAQSLSNGKCIKFITHDDLVIGNILQKDADLKQKYYSLLGSSWLLYLPHTLYNAIVRTKNIQTSGDTTYIYSEPIESCNVVLKAFNTDTLPGRADISAADSPDTDDPVGFAVNMNYNDDLLFHLWFCEYITNYQPPFYYCYIPTDDLHKYLQTIFLCFFHIAERAITSLQALEDAWASAPANLPPYFHAKPEAIETWIEVISESSDLKEILLNYKSVWNALLALPTNLGSDSNTKAIDKNIKKILRETIPFSTLNKLNKAVQEVDLLYRIVQRKGSKKEKAAVAKEYFDQHKQQFIEIITEDLRFINFENIRNNKRDSTRTVLERVAKRHGIFTVPKTQLEDLLKDCPKPFTAKK